MPATKHPYIEPSQEKHPAREQLLTDQLTPINTTGRASVIDRRRQACVAIGIVYTHSLPGYAWHTRRGRNYLIL